jgi:DNA-binding response OmpR family regulator
MTARILIAEDETAMRRGVAILLQAKGYEVIEAANGTEALVKARGARPDLLVLDVMMPGQTGFEVLQALRASGAPTPVIMLTAKGTESDKVLGFALGVDDYVTKPFSTLELLGRIEAVLRRCRPRVPAAEGLGTLRIGAADVDFGRLEVRRAGRVVDLPVRALDVLFVLARAEGRVVARDDLLDAVWGGDAVNPRTLDNVMVKLRQAIEPEPERPSHLVTVRGRGYRLDQGPGTGV